MPVVFLLLVYGYTDNKIIQVGLLAITVSRLYKRKRYRFILFLILASLIHYGINHFDGVSFGNEYRVIKSDLNKVTLQNGMLQYLIYDVSYEIGSTLEIEGSPTFYEDRTQYQRINRIQGYFDVAQVSGEKSPGMFHTGIADELEEYPSVYNFVYGNDESIVSALSLQILGLRLLLNTAIKRVLERRKRPIAMASILGIYGVLFNFEYSIIRAIIAELFPNRVHQMILLLLIFPKAQFHLSFMVVYGPYILKNTSNRFENNSVRALRFWLIQYVFGSSNSLSIILYRFYGYITALIIVTLCAKYYSMSEILVNLLRETPKNLNFFSILGAPLGLTLVYILFSKSKLQSWKRVLISICITVYFPFPRVVFIDVGQGDATLITTPFNTHITLIDTGRAFAYKTLTNTINKLGIKQIDQVIITHDDLDHNESVETLTQDFNVQSIITEKGSDVLWLTELLSENVYNSPNENSLIFILKTPRRSFLFMGDAYVAQELDIMRLYPRLHVDVLKLGHHGSKTSTSQKFIQSIRPTLSVISSKPSVYGHPHESVMKTLYQNRVLPLLTATDGTLTFVFTPFFDFYVSDGKRFGIME